MTRAINISGFLVLLLFQLLSSIYSLNYKEGEEVVIYVNKVGPFHNPQETYHYYKLPVCTPQKIESKSLSLGEVLDGDRMAKSLYKIEFKKNVEKKTICKYVLHESKFKQLVKAIEDLYYFEFVIDDIPMRDFLGYLDESGFLPHKHKVYFGTHLKFTIEYNDANIVFANVTADSKYFIALHEKEPPLEIEYSYSVDWISTPITYKQRESRVQDIHFFPTSLEIHWLSIINSIILVWLLMGFVVFILLRILKTDFAKYNSYGEDEDDDSQVFDECGWKVIHTDVFRIPPRFNLLAAILGVGCQFLAISSGIILLALTGFFNVHNHGAVNSAACGLYALTSFIAGYVASSFYKKFGGKNWAQNTNLTCALFSFPFFFIWSIENTIAWVYHSTQALPATTCLLLVFVWLFVGYPLTIAGSIFGKRFASPLNAPCRTKNIPREIPSASWYRGSLFHCFVGGLLPFSAISVEMYYIFSTLWGREHYTLYGILAVVFVIVISVDICISVALTYLQLSVEDYRWWWRSIVSAGSVGVYILAYAGFYFLFRSNMSGLLQTVKFFGWTLMTCYVFFLTLGTISFLTSLTFVKYIYARVKID